MRLEDSRTRFVFDFELIIDLHLKFVCFGFVAGDKCPHHILPITNAKISALFRVFLCPSRLCNINTREKNVLIVDCAYLESVRFVMFFIASSSLCGESDCFTFSRTQFYFRKLKFRAAAKYKTYINDGEEIPRGVRHIDCTPFDRFTFQLISSIETMNSY